eukprot:601624-Pyramimonas_sp.AAC.1
MVQKLDAQGNPQYSVFNGDSGRSPEAIQAASRMARLNNRRPWEGQMSTGQEGATQEDIGRMNQWRDPDLADKISVLLDSLYIAERLDERGGWRQAQPPLDTSSISTTRATRLRKWLRGATAKAD